MSEAEQPSQYRVQTNIDPEQGVELERLAAVAERSVAAEARLALRFWIDVNNAPTQGNTGGSVRISDTRPSYRTE